MPLKSIVIQAADQCLALNQLRMKIVIATKKSRFAPKPRRMFMRYRTKMFGLNLKQIAAKIIQVTVVKNIVFVDLLSVIII